MISEKNLEVFGYECISAYSNKITDFGAFSQTNMITFKDKGVLFLRNQDIREGYIDENNSVFIDESIYNKLTLHLEEGDILIPRVGTLGNAALIKKNMLPCTSNQNLAIIRLKNEINKYAIIAILVSKIGNYQINRLSTGNVQQWLNLATIGNIKIPCLANDFMDKVGNLMEMSNISIIKSNEKYYEAENLLLSELDLENFNPSSEKVSIKTLKESFLKTGRLDSEYYQPKYDEILNKITKYGCSEFTNFVDRYTTGYPYSSDSYVEKDGIVLIKISNINNFKLDISSASLIPKNDIDLSAENVVQKNDILVSMSGTIGNSCVVQDDIKAVVNQRIMKIKSKNINPVVFSLIINSMIGKNQLERIQTGGVQANISPKDILKIQIPCIKTSVQDEIASYIKQSMEYSKKAKELLEISTKSVEIAIDKDEQAAHNFLEQNRTEQNSL